MAEPLARFQGFEATSLAEPLARFEGFEGFKGFEGFEGLHFPYQTLPLNP